jgi:anti-sigma-K factor RskA
MTEPHAWTDFAASYALDALDERERAAFEAHLAQCSQCREDVDSYRMVAGLLAFTAEPRSPSPELKQRILRSARQVRPITSAAERRTQTSAETREPQVSRPRATWPVAAAACLLLALATLFLYTRERGFSEQLRDRIAALQDSAAAKQDSIAALGSAVSRRDSLLSAILSADVRTVTLAARGQPPSARFYWNRARGVVVIAAFDLPPARPGRTYQAWGIAAGGAPVSLGTFNTAADGRGTITLNIDSTLDMQIAAVTEEPAGGSPQPTSQPFLVGSF